jgi:GTP-binding protein Era
VDLLKDKSQLLPLIEEYRAVYEFADYVPVSSVKRGGTAELLKVILKYMPAGPLYFPEDHVTDQPERFLAGELIREKVLRATRQEVPHAVAVTVDKWEDGPKMTTIYATIHLERDGQKAIVIGTGGAMLKQIGTQARQEMERLFGLKIYLDLHVRVQPNWRENRSFLNALDWRTMTGEDDA